MEKWSGCGLEATMSSNEWTRISVLSNYFRIQLIDFIKGRNGQFHLLGSVFVYNKYHQFAHFSSCYTCFPSKYDSSWNNIVWNIYQLNLRHSVPPFCHSFMFVIIFSLFQWLYHFKQFLTICTLILRKYNFLLPNDAKKIK